MEVYRAFVQRLYEQLRVTRSLEASLQTSQTDTKLPWQIWQVVNTVSFLFLLWHPGV
jgi:hypothetical protein